MSPTATGLGLAVALFAALAIGAGLTINATRALRAAEVRIRLDASRRWVTLSGVHPDFVASVEERNTAWR